MTTKWSWRIGRVAGIDIRIHAAFLILIAWAAAAPLLGGQGARAALLSVALVASVFGLVVLHELGHALTARRFGIGTRDITLLPIGGVAQLERAAYRPSEELLIALAGPAVNVGLVLPLLGAVALSEGGLASLAIGASQSSWLAMLFWANASLALFNLLPAFPLDGGRVLRALLALRLERVRATWIAARIGQAFAVGLGLLGLLGSPMLLLVALFVGFAAEMEARATQAIEQHKRALAGGWAWLPAQTRSPMLWHVRVVVATAPGRSSNG